MASNHLKSYLLEANANLRPLFYEIVKQCERRNIRYDKQLVTFIMNLVSLDPKFEIYMETLSADRRNHDDFVEECVRILGGELAGMGLVSKVLIHDFEDFQRTVRQAW